MTVDEERQIARFCDLAAMCYTKGRYLFTDFLGLAELDLFLRAARDFSYLPYTLFGGADGCERVMARLGSEDTLGYGPDAFPIACLRVAPTAPKFAEALTHRDYLGALLNLGIERKCIGDIVQDGASAYVFCVEKMADYLCENLSRVRHTAVICERASAPSVGERRMEAVTVQLMSERLDALIAHVYGLSRADAAALFPAGRVFVNGRVCESGSYICREGDVISTRGAGRLIFRGVTGKTRKGKDSVLVEKYV